MSSDAIQHIRRDMYAKQHKLRKKINKAWKRIEQAMGIETQEDGTVEAIDFEPISKDQFNILWDNWFNLTIELEQAVDREFKEWSDNIK